MPVINSREKFLVTTSVAMPHNMNQDGNAFGGWILSLMDLASVIASSKVCAHRVVTRGVSDVSFDFPVALGDLVSVYAQISKLGNTSICFNIDVHAKSRGGVDRRAVSGKFTMVALDENNNPVNISTPLQPVNSNARKV